MEEFLAITVLGLSTAAIFALAASGLVLTYTTTGIFNFAHGAIGDARRVRATGSSTSTGAGRSRSPSRRSLLVIAPGLGVADRARDHARAGRRARDGPDRRHDQPARRAPRRRRCGSGRRRRCTGSRCCSRVSGSSIFGVNVTYHDLFTFVVAIAGGHRPAAAAVPHAGRPRHAGQRRQPSAGDAPRRSAPPLGRDRLGHRLRAGRAWPAS